MDPYKQAKLAAFEDELAEIEEQNRADHSEEDAREVVLDRFRQQRLEASEE